MCCLAYMVYRQSCRNLLLSGGCLRSRGRYFGTLAWVIFSGCMCLFSTISALLMWSGTGLGDLRCVSRGFPLNENMLSFSEINAQRYKSWWCCNRWQKLLHDLKSENKYEQPSLQMDGFKPAQYAKFHFTGGGSTFFFGSWKCGVNLLFVKKCSMM